jgi:hypothetical protein
MIGEMNKKAIPDKRVCDHQKVIATIDYSGNTPEVWAICLECGLDEKGIAFQTLRGKPTFLLHNEDYWGMDTSGREQLKGYGEFKLMPDL